MAEIVLDRLTKSYPDGAMAVRELSLTIAEGEFIILVGPSGCGKSTTLNMIAGLEDISSGELRIGGERVNEKAPKDRDIAMVFQSYALYPHMTVRQNIAFPLTLGKMKKAQIAEKVEETARILDLTELLDRKPAQLSGGQRQRVAMGRAIVRHPKAFLMDEPLSNLDAKLRVQMRGEIARLQRRLGTTTVYVTHDQSEAMTTADLIAVMNAGRIEQLGPPEDIYARPRSEFVARFIGSSNIVKGKALDAGHIAVAGIPVSCTGAGLAAGTDAAISIRQHEIRIDTAEPAGERRNVLPAVVARNVFLGNSRDYMVEIGDGTQIRVVTSPEENIVQGSKVWLRLPAERCRVLES